MKQTLQLLRSQLVQLGAALKGMALEHRHTVMVARTNSVDASATTWGLHVSSYLSELTRHIQRLDRLCPAATTGLFGGAVGNLASVGSQGMEIRKQLMGALGLSCPVGMNNASQDHVVEAVQFLPWCTARCAVWRMTSKRRGAHPWPNCVKAKEEVVPVPCRTRRTPCQQYDPDAFPHGLDLCFRCDQPA